MPELGKDLGYTLRGFLRTPVFTLVVVVTLALGIGANTAIFSVVDAVLLQPLPIPEDERMVFMGARSENGFDVSVSIPNYFSWRELNRSYESTGMFRTSNLNLSGDGEPERLQSVQVLGELFETLARAPQLGRTIRGEETLKGAERLAVISHSLWQRRFDSDPEVPGSTALLDGEPFTIVGVMPQDFFFPLSESDVWVPMGLYADVLPWEIRGNSPGSYVVGRLREGLSLDQAQEDMARVGALVTQEFDWRGTPQVESLRERYLGQIRTGLLLLFGAVGFVLLIACANVANLLLSRAEHRQREIAVRAALGAGTGRILRQLLLESTTLGLAGGVAGGLAGWGGVRVLLSALPQGTPFIDRIRLDASVLLFTLGISLVTGLIFGLAPVVHILRTDLRGALSEGGGRSGDRGRGRLRGTLVAAEVALALVLLVGASLMLRSFSRLQTVDPGFDAHNVLIARISPPASSYPDKDAWRRLFERVVDEASSIPGVRTAALNNGIPLASGGTESGSIPEGRTFERESFESCLYQAVSGDYFSTLGIPLLKGRHFARTDTEDTPAVAVIDETMARKFWPDEDPIGRRVAFEFTGTQDAPEPIWREVVGVVGHVRHYELRSPSRVQIYVPFTQPPLWFERRQPEMAIFLKTESAPTAALSSLRQAVRGIDANLPLYNIMTMEEVIDREVANDRLLGSNLGVFAAIALALAAVGLYGVMAYSVSQRTHELGLRMALGARRREVLRLVLMRALRLIGIGIAVGLVISLGLSSVVGTLLYEVSAVDPATFLGIVALLILVGTVASAIPAYRASRIDPLEALHYE